MLQARTSTHPSAGLLNLCAGAFFAESSSGWGGARDRARALERFVLALSCEAIREQRRWVVEALPPSRPPLRTTRGGPPARSHICRYCRMGEKKLSHLAFARLRRFTLRFLEWARATPWW